MEDATDAELTAVFGLRAEYYIAGWRARSRWRPNWAAFFWTGAWLIFRRMYVGVGLLYFALVVEALLEKAITTWLGFATVPGLVDYAKTPAIAVVCGVWGNRWYFRHVRSILAETRALTLPEEEHLRELARRGRTRPLHVLAAALIGVVVLVALVRVVGLLQGR